MVLDILVPGFAKDDLEVTVKGDILTVKGEKPHRVESKNVEFIKEEFCTDSFERKYKLSEEISTDRMEAKCENGILHISFIENHVERGKKAHKVEVA